MRANLQNLLIISGLMIFCGTAASATPVIDERQKAQKFRIIQGVKTGELTTKETRKAVKGQRQLRKMERRAKADGKVTAKERIRLHKKATKESTKIKRDKHNNQKQH
jgi:hypothetical protein